MGEQSQRYFSDYQAVGFPSTHPSYDPRAAWWTAHCSKLTYEDKPKVRQELQRGGFERVYFFDMRGTQGFLALHPGDHQRFAILAFRGTEKNYLDVLTDILIFKTKLPDTGEKPDSNQGVADPAAKLFAHGGFMEAFLWVWGTALPQVQDPMAIPAEWVGSRGVSNLIEEKVYPDRLPLYVTGHSLGGALATLTAYHALVHHDNVQLYTFGCPRVANRPLAKQIDAQLEMRSYRCVHGWDIVPRVPPFFSYHHVPQLVFFDRNQRRVKPRRRTLTDSLIIVLMLVETLVSTLLAMVLFFVPNGVESAIAKAVSGGKRTQKVFMPITTADHRIDCYIESVEKQLRQIRP